MLYMKLKELLCKVRNIRDWFYIQFPQIKLMARPEVHSSKAKKQKSRDRITRWWSFISITLISHPLKDRRLDTLTS